jgi:peptidoglycan/LPS O-acetylase OafA/YrhL
LLISGVVPLAAASYHLIERPARERLREWVPAAGERGLKITPV